MDASTRTTGGVPADKILDLDPLCWKLDRCEKHGLVMTEAIVPLRWGNDRPEDFDRDYLVASVALFPHAEDPFLLGGLNPSHGETHARVRHCAKCIEVKAEWLKTHPNVDECGTLPNKPLQRLTNLPQGNRSNINEPFVRQARLLNGKAFGGPG